MTSLLIAFVLTLALMPLALLVAASLAFSRGAWRLSRALGRLGPYVFGSDYGGSLAFQSEAFALREEGKITEATALVKARLLEPERPAWNRNSRRLTVLVRAVESSLRWC